MIGVEISSILFYPFGIPSLRNIQNLFFIFAILFVIMDGEQVELYLNYCQVILFPNAKLRNRCGHHNH